MISRRARRSPAERAKFAVIKHFQKLFFNLRDIMSRTWSQNPIAVTLLKIERTFR